MENKKKIVITCGQVLTSNKHNLVSLFPQKINDKSYKVTYSEYKKRNMALSIFYKSVLKQLSSKISLINGYSKNNYEILFRPVLVNLTTAYLDRSIRLINIVKKNKNKPTILQSRANTNYSRNDLLSFDFNNNEDLNLKLIEFIGASLDLDTINLNRCEIKKLISPKNKMFLPQHHVIKQFLIRCYNSLLIRIKKFNNKKTNIYTHNLFCDDYWFCKARFYGPFGIFRNIDKVNLSKNKIDHNYREKIKIELSHILEEKFLILINSLSEINITKKESQNLTANYIDFLFKFFPSNFLEGIKTNLDKTNKIFQNKKKPILLCNSPSMDESYYIAASIKEKKGIIIGQQHGGHLGYIEDMPIFAEGEYALCDFYITNGWSNFNKNYPTSKPIILPSPRLSYLKRNSKFMFKKINNKILFMPNLYRKFTLGTIGQVSSDYLELINNHYIDLAKNLNFQNYDMYIKPYDNLSYQLIEETFNKMEDLSLNKIKISKIRQKGLSPKITNSFDLLIWDQIGSGAIDCFVSKIPTMIYWNKIYSFESVEAENAITQLVNAKIIHETSLSLNKEISIFYNNPSKWQNNITRVRAIENFNKTFALTSNNWSISWKTYFKKIIANDKFYEIH